MSREVSKLTLLLLILCTNVIGIICGEECTIGSKPQEIRYRRSETNGLYLNTRNPTTCTGTLLYWRFCAYIQPMNSTNCSVPPAEIHFGLWQISKANDTVHYNCIHSSKWSPSCDVLQSGYEFVCERWTLPAEDQFVVEVEDLVVGVYVPPNVPVHLVGVSNGSTIYHNSHRNADELKDGVSSANETRNFSFYLEAGIEAPTGSDPNDSESDNEEDSRQLLFLSVLVVLLTVILSLLLALAVAICKIWSDRKRKLKTYMRARLPEETSLGVRLSTVTRRRQPLTQTTFTNPVALEHDTSSTHGEDGDHVTLPSSRANPNTLRQFDRSLSETDVVRLRIATSEDEHSSMPHLYESLDLGGRRALHCSRSLDTAGPPLQVPEGPRGQSPIVHIQRSGSDYEYPYTWRAFSLPHQHQRDTKEHVPPRNVPREPQYVNTMPQRQDKGHLVPPRNVLRIPKGTATLPHKWRAPSPRRKATASSDESSEAPLISTKEQENGDQGHVQDSNTTTTALTKSGQSPVTLNTVAEATEVGSRETGEAGGQTLEESYENSDQLPLNTSRAQTIERMSPVMVQGARVQPDPLEASYVNSEQYPASSGRSPPVDPLEETYVNSDQYPASSGRSPPVVDSSEDLTSDTAELLHGTGASGTRGRYTPLTILTKDEKSPYQDINIM